MQRNKIWAVRTIDLVAQELGEDAEWLDEISIEMDPEDGLIRVYGLNDEATLAFSDDGVESLRELIAIHRNNQS